VGQRSRKRRAAAAVAPPPRPAPVARPARRGGAPFDRRARMGEAPKAPWSPFPLIELAILLAIVLILAGLFVGGPRRGVLLGGGLALVTVAGLELALREHFSGFRSHSTLLAAACAVLVDVPLYLLTGLPQELLLVVGVLIFALAFTLLRGAFRRRAGGLGFRI
jgi:hypothetical protein